ncbi:MAG: 1-acyl-sn-glycerol-3-phosphate acyltransferase [Chloroflexota bacterium]|jgi:1-acyl-sn-glycerol-3-phosphate acyltransferase
MVTREFPLAPTLRLGVDQLHAALEDEIFRLSGWARRDPRRRLIQALISKPLSRFAGRLSRLDEDIHAGGLQMGLERLLTDFVSRIHFQPLEAFPRSGGVIVACNHPGTFDGFVLANLIQREDVRVIARDMPLLRGLPAISRHVIFSTRDMAQRSEVLRKGIAHLNNGGALLTFPRGTIEPDPANQTGAMSEVRHWLPSLEFWLRKAPHARLVIGTISGIVSPTALKMAGLLFRGAWNAQVAAEIGQVIVQVLAPQWWKIEPQVTFSAPLSLPRLQAESMEKRLFPVIQAHVLRNMVEHLRHFHSPTLPY